MKIKLLKIFTGKEENYFNSSDDYETIYKYIVSSYTDYEEITPEELRLLESFITEYNTKVKRGDDDYFLMIVFERAQPVKEIIKDLVAKEQKRLDEQKEAARKREEERLKKIAETSLEKARKKKERAERQLAKLKKELGEV